MVLMPCLLGGLGNQIFAVGAVWCLAKKLNEPFLLSRRYVEASCFKHTDRRYIESVFSRLPQGDDVATRRVGEPSGPTGAQTLFQSLAVSESPDRRVLLHGYFQDHRYFEEFGKEFFEELVLPEPPSRAVDARDAGTSALLEDCCFVHVRRGDYLTIPFHNVLTESYYERALEHVARRDPSVTFLVVTDDLDYVFGWSLLKRYRSVVVGKEHDEVATLAMMTRCGRGGICANSSYSWLGGYFNRHRTVRTDGVGAIFVLPNKWFNDAPCSPPGYYYPGAVVLPH